MNKKLKLFFKIIYYLFTFGIGIVLAFTMPGMKFYERLAYTMEYSLNNGDYDTAMSLIGGYYDDRQVVEEQFDDGSGVVIYSAAVEALKNDTEDKKPKYEMKKTYAGFLFNTQSKYQVKANEANKTRLVVEDKLGNEATIELLNYDSDKDKKFDSVTTLEEYSYVYFEIPVGAIDSISRLTFYDREDKVYREVSSLSLSFEEQFFTDVNDFVDKYNSTTSSEDLKILGDRFLKMDSAYKQNDPTDIYNKSNRDAVIFVLVYFILIYILGDFLVGHRFIWHGALWCYGKIRDAIERRKKAKSGEVIESTPEPVISTVNTLLKFQLDTPKDYNGTVTINYHNENKEINLIFTKDNGYKQSMAVPSGTYVNAWLECSGYETINLPKTLEVKGYRMTVNVTLKKSDKKLENDEQIIDDKNGGKR